MGTVFLVGKALLSVILFSAEEDCAGFPCPLVVNPGVLEIALDKSGSIIRCFCSGRSIGFEEAALAGEAKGFKEAGLAGAAAGFEAAGLAGTGFGGGAFLTLLEPLDGATILHPLH